MDKAVIRINNRQRRDNAVRRRVDHLYNTKRKRLDDVIQEVADEFYLSTITVKNILKH